MAKGTSEYMKPKKKTIRELEEATGSKAPPSTKPPTQPKPKKQWWER